MIKSGKIIIPITLLSIFAATFGIINIIPIVNTYAKGNEKNNEVINTNQAPLARSVEKLLTVNSTCHINLFSLTTDIDVDNLAYFKIIELPAHGILSVHSEFYGDVKYYQYNQNSDPKDKKFDGHFLYIRYTPDNDFRGKDYFKYIVVDGRGKKSNEATITVSYEDNKIIKHNHKPVALNTSIKTSINVPVTVDIQSLTYDLDGDFIHVKTNKHTYPAYITNSGQSHTLNKRVHGVTVGQYYFHYVPSSIGDEEIRYEIWDHNNPKISSFGSIAYKILPSTSTPIIKYRLKEVWILIGLAFGVVLFFPLSITAHLRIRWLKAAGGILLLVGTSIMSKVLYARIIYADRYLWGFSHISFIYLAILMIILGICLLNTNRIETWRAYILKIGDQYLFLIMILLLNSAILLYHYTITIPPKALDTWGYVALYDFFKYGIHGYTVPEHHTRILVPYLASLLPIDNIWISFKFVTVVFLNFAVMILCWTWKKLNVKNYLMGIGIIWMSFHQYGAVRYQNIYATDINISTYFFYAVLVYIIYTKRYWGLLFIAPFAVLQREVILFFILALLVFHFCSFIITKYMPGVFRVEQRHLTRKVRNHQNAIFFIICAIFLCFVALQLPSYINPQPYDMFGASILMIIDKFLTQPLSLYLIIIMFFINYCGLFLLGVLNIKKSFKNDDMFICMTIFVILNIISSMISPQYRFQVFAYPFIMTLILLSINNMNFFTVTIGIILSLPFMGLSNNPIFYDPPHRYFGIVESPMVFVNAIGIYMIIVFIVLYLLKSSSLPENITTFFSDMRGSRSGVNLKN